MLVTFNVVSALGFPTAGQQSNCDPTLLCGQALTCVNGQQYGTTCGPDNCDVPYGPCDDRPLLGGTRDENGCLGSAGYSWCEARGECIRHWETDCETEDHEEQQEAEQTTQQMVDQVVEHVEQHVEEMVGEVEDLIEQLGGDASVVELMDQVQQIGAVWVQQMSTQMQQLAQQQPQVEPVLQQQQVDQGLQHVEQVEQGVEQVGADAPQQQQQQQHVDGESEQTAQQMVQANLGEQMQQIAEQITEHVQQQQQQVVEQQQQQQVVEQVMGAEQAEQVMSGEQTEQSRPSDLFPSDVAPLFQALTQLASSEQSQP